MSSRIYNDNRDELGFDMGDGLDNSWVLFEPFDGGIRVDQFSADGDVVLSPEHARLLAARLVEWADRGEK